MITAYPSSHTVSKALINELLTIHEVQYQQWQPVCNHRVHGHSDCSITHVCGLQANQIGHIVCGSCHITLMYAYGAASVKCQVCNAVTPANQSTMTHQPGPSNSNSGSGAASSRPQESQQTVVIVNPPTLDAEGNEVRLHVFASSSRYGTCAAWFSEQAVKFALLLISKTTDLLLSSVYSLSCLCQLFCYSSSAHEQEHTNACCCQVEDYVVGVSSDPGQQAARQHSRPRHNS